MGQPGGVRTEAIIDSRRRDPVHHGNVMDFARLCYSPCIITKTPTPSAGPTSDANITTISGLATNM
jgi:hypothetical protein